MNILEGDILECMYACVNLILALSLSLSLSLYNIYISVLYISWYVCINVSSYFLSVKIK